jgi:multidrug resistance efflux pump
MSEHSSVWNTRDLAILRTSRIFGYIFALTLLFIMALAMLPNQFFIVSKRAQINAPVQVITSPIYGRVNDISLQVGQVVSPGEVTASISNPNLDETSLVGLRLDSIDLDERLRKSMDSLQQRRARLKLLEGQITEMKQGVLDELQAVITNADAMASSYRARLAEQQALLEQRYELVKKGVISKTSLEPLRQKRDSAQYELAAAESDLRRQTVIRTLISDGIYTSSSVAGNLATLELQKKDLAAEIAGLEAEVEQISQRKSELGDVMAHEEKRSGEAGEGDAVARHFGQIISVDASRGDFLVQGQPLARSLDCDESFVIAVYPGRDVASLDIGTPAMVNIKSLGQKRSAHIQKIVRFFDSGSDDRYYERLPEADPHEVYVILKMDPEDASDQTGATSENDRFFGCHVGEDVVVSLGEPLVAKLGRYYSFAVSRAYAEVKEPELSKAANTVARPGREFPPATTATD